MPRLYREIIEEIRAAVTDKPIYLQVDETADYLQRPLVSIIVGVLDGKRPRSYLFDLIRLEESPNSTLIMQVINNTLYYLWGGTYDYDKLKVLISDQAAYMLKAGRDMKASLYPKLLHITCLCHALHNVCQLAKTEYPHVYQLMRHFRKVFVKCPRRKTALAICLEAPLPKFPVDTRWGTWIKFCSFLAANYDEIKTFTALIKDERNSSILDLMDIMEDSETVAELVKISELQFLCDSITKLETSGLTIFQQKEMIDDALRRLQDPFRAKLLSLLGNNPAYEEVFSQPSIREQARLLYLPLVSVDVERSFSAIKLIDTSRRQSFTITNLKHYAIVYINKSIEGEEIIEPIQMPDEELMEIEEQDMATG